MIYDNAWFLIWFLVLSWSIYATIHCLIVPSLGIFIAYYDWEFADGYKNEGYKFQYQFFNFLLIVIDCAIIPLGFAGMCAVQ